jgi:hypothetical protein
MSEDITQYTPQFITLNGLRYILVGPEDMTRHIEGVTGPDKYTNYPTLSGSAHKAIKVRYTNREGSILIRSVIPIEIRFGLTEWHKDKQWYMLALCVDSNAEEYIPLKDCDFLTVNDKE